VTIDVGTGDGRAVLAAASADPGALTIGIDANAASMAEASRRASRPVRKGGTPNAMFLVAAAEALPAALHGIADLVTVRFPWGSLLRGCLGGDEAVTAGIASLLRGGGVVELLLAPADRDRLEGLPTDPSAAAEAAVRAFAALGLRPLEARPATSTEVLGVASTWARRLLVGGRSEERPVTLVRMRSSAG
jgi:16S rRNA (adenine(1408)-N(1))-methyltransferase